MTDPPLDPADFGPTAPFDIELFGASATGLPYPESSDALNQGANAIKALALALDSRGSGWVVEAAQFTQNVSGGNISRTFGKAFRVAPIVVFNVYALGTSYVPVPGLASVTTTGFTAFAGAASIGATASGIQPWGGNITVNYVALGVP